MNSKFKIISIKLINSSFYDLEKNIDCTICRCNLNENSLHSVNKISESVVVTGACGHSFHNECITPWLKNNNHCPICSHNWIYG